MRATALRSTNIYSQYYLAHYFRLTMLALITSKFVAVQIAFYSLGIRWDHSLTQLGKAILVSKSHSMDPDNLLLSVRVVVREYVLLVPKLLTVLKRCRL